MKMGPLPPYTPFEALVPMFFLCLRVKMIMRTPKMKNESAIGWVIKIIRLLFEIRRDLLSEFSNVFPRMSPISIGIGEKLRFPIR